MDGRNATQTGEQHLSTGVLVFIVVASVFLLTGMGRQIRRDVSQDPTFSWIIGRQYQTKKDVVLLKYSSREKILRLKEFGDTVPSRDEIGNKFPYNHKGYNNIILGVLPAGSIFNVKRVEERGHSSATFVHYVADIISSNNQTVIGKEVDATHLTNMSVPPRFEEKLVEELKQEQNR